MPSSSVILRCPSCRSLNRVPADKLASHPICGSCKAGLRFPSAPINADTASFDREVNDWPGTLLIEFWSATCGYCQIVEPVVNDIARWKAGALKVLKVDVRSELSLAQRFQAMATPTFVLLRNGQQLARIDGAPREKIDLVRWVEQFL